MQGARVIDLSTTIAGAFCARTLGAAGADVVKVEPPGGDPLRQSRAPWPALAADAPLDRRHPAGIQFAYLHAYKRGIVLDLETAAGATALDQLIAAADLVVSSFEGNADAALRRHQRIAAVNPRVVHTVVSSYGLTGPYRDYRASDLTDWAVSGYLHITGDPARAPLQGGGPWTAHACGLTAAIGSAAALLHARATGEGQLVDAGLIEAMAALHQWSLTMYTHLGVVKQRAGNRHAESYHPMGLLPVRDGWICLGTATVAQWEQFCLAIDMPELLVDPRFATGADRLDHADQLDELLAVWLRRRGRDEAVAYLQQHRVPASPVQTPRELLDDPQLVERQFWVTPRGFDSIARMPQAAFHAGGEPPVYRDAPLLGEHTAAVRREWRGEDRAPATRSPVSTRARAGAARETTNSTTTVAPKSSAMLASSDAMPAVEAPVSFEPSTRGRAAHADRPALPLTGVRVLELAVAWAGPLAARWLADLGAEVIKVEHMTARGLGVATTTMTTTDQTEPWRWGTLPPPPFRSGIYPDAVPGDRPWNRQGIFNKMNRNKRSLSVDLKHPAGREAFLGLVAVSDVVLDNYSPRAMPGLGFDYTSLAALNPSIICASLTGYGHSGPLKQRVSYGPILEAHSGLAAATGYGDGTPYKLGHAFPDAIGGLSGAVAVLDALWRRQQSGRGCFVDLSQLETYASIAGDLLLATSLAGEPPPPLGNRSTVYAPQGVYRCQGADHWLALTVRDVGEWKRLVDVIDNEELRDRAFESVAGRFAAHDLIDQVIGRWAGSLDKHQAMALLQEAGVTAAAALSNADLVGSPHLAARGFMVEVDQVDVGPRRFPGHPLHFSATPLPPPRGTPALGGDNTALLADLLGYAAGHIRRLEAQRTIGTGPLPA